MKIKRYLSVFLATAVMTTMLAAPIIVKAANTYTINGSGVLTAFSGSGAVVIPSNVTSIASNVFEYNTHITSVTFASGSECTSIGNGAFVECTGITSVDLSNSICTSIGNEAFEYCSGLTSITLSNVTTPTLLTIGNYAFWDCDNSSLTSITLPDTVTSIGEYAFGYCDKLTSMTIPASLTTIGAGAFSMETNITGFTVAGGTNFSTDSNGVLFNYNKTLLIAYPNHNGLTSYTIPGTVTEIGAEAFAGCLNLSGVMTIPTSVTVIDEYAFSGCSEITGITFASTSKVATIATGVFDSCDDLTSITIPASVTSMGDYVFDECTNLSSVGVDSNNLNYESIGGVLYSKDGKTLIEYPYLIGATYTIPIIVTSIGDYAFADDSNLTGITFASQSNLASIGEGAFVDCPNLTAITIPNSVTSIGDSAFSECGKLANVTIPNKITEITDEAFDGDSSLTSIVIPNGVTSIGEEAFYSCSGLTSVTLPNTLSSMGYEAFADCTSLSTLIIPSSVTILASYVFDGDNITKMYFLGNAPATIDTNAFADLYGALVFYINVSATGFTLGSGGTWQGLPTQIYCNLIFNSEGGTSEPTQMVNYSSAGSKPSPDPTNGSDTFGGWYSNSAFTNAFDFTTPLTANTTVYAKWTSAPATTTTNPQTGDTSMISVFLMLFALSGITLFVVKRRIKTNKISK